MLSYAEKVADQLVSPVDAGDLVLGSTELFFSTTDRRGVIGLGNSVFARVSGYALDELVGQPHNVVRHPDMPAGMFRLMWERLADGRPVGAFVRNRAKDGTAYWVFATMSPVPDGYVSVRLAPCSPYFGLAEQVYAQARTAEQASRRSGNDRRGIAASGMAGLEEALRRHGFRSYDEFMHEALPAEIAARGNLVSATSLRPDVSGPIGSVLAGTALVDARLAQMVGRLGEYRELCGRLMAAATRVADITRRIDRSVVAARDASARVADEHPVLLNIARVMGEPMSEAVTALHTLGPELDRLCTAVTELRFRISLAALYNSMVAAFAAEVVDGAAPARTLKAVPLLCDATAIGLCDMADQMREVNAQLSTVAQQTERASAALDRFRRFLGQWRLRVLRHKAGPAIGAKLDPIDAEIAVSWEWMDLLHGLGREFHSGAVIFDFVTVEAQLAAIKLAAAECDTD
ncbi:PAS domain-containing protein [Nocardia sp. NPDC049707]|uniref:PAS domain-containing protein n=1 Tax=Nocardia sp. NPDC049707 TaxID=3154735 RepID=UPI003436822D